MLNRTLPMLLLSTAIALAAGCGRDEQAVPEASSRTAEQTGGGQAVTLTGCLRAGDAAGTFVLTSPETNTGERAATYHLLGAEEVRLQDHVGQQVQVTGTLAEGQHVEDRTMPRPTDEAAETTGSPAVSTETEVAIQRVEVQSVAPAGGRCE